MKNKLINTAKLGFLYTIRFLLPYLDLKLVHMLGDVLGKVAIGPKQALIKEDLRVLLNDRSEKELDSIILKTMQNFRKDLFEIWMFPKFNQKTINRLAYVEGMQHLKEALGRGKGVIFCVTHFGSYKTILPVMGYNGFKITQVAANPMVFVDENEDRYHNKVMSLELKSEASLPAQFIYVDKKKSVRPVYRLLAKNEIVVISMDGVVGGGRMMLPFLNGEVLLSTGPAKLAYNTGAALVPLFTVRQADNRHKLIIHKPRYFDRKSESEASIIPWMIEFGKLFEFYIKKYPDHYARFLYTIRKYPLSEVGEILKKRSRG